MFHGPVSAKAVPPGTLGLARACAQISRELGSIGGMFHGLGALRSRRSGTRYVTGWRWFWDGTKMVLGRHYYRRHLGHCGTCP